MDNQNEQFRQDLRRCMEMRLEVLSHILAENEEYKAIKEEMAALFSEIREGLPEHLKDKVDQCSEYQARLTGIEHPFVYQNAFSDVIKLVKFVFGEDKVPFT